MTPLAFEPAGSFFLMGLSIFLLVEEVKEALRLWRRVSPYSLRLSRARFDVGAATQLDVLQAQNALIDAGNNQVQALYLANVSGAQWCTAMRLDPEVK